MSKKHKRRELVGQVAESPKKRLIDGKTVILWVVFLIFVGLSLWLRVGLQHQELAKEGLMFTDVDAYYHLMGADYTYANFPQIQSFNDLLDWPAGQVVNQRPLWEWLIAATAKIFGVTVDRVGFYAPPFVFILTLIPVFFIGWLLWNRWAGLIGACSLAVIQGEIFGRTSLGFCDQHVLEIFLSCMVFLFIIMAIKKHWAWSILAGFMLGLQYFNWAGAPIFTLILLIFMVIQSVIMRFQNKSIRSFMLASLVIMLVSFIMFLIFRGNEGKYVLFYGCSVLAPLFLLAIDRVTSKWKPFTFAVGIVAVVGASVGVLSLIMGETVVFAFKELSGLLGSVGSSGVSLGNTISEVQPILYPYGTWTLDVVWGCFTMVSIIGIIGLIILCFKTESKEERILFIIWSIVTIILTILQRRYAYYLSVNLCLLSGFAFYFILNKIGWRKHTTKEVKRGMPPKYFHPMASMVGAILVIISIIIPNYVIAEKTSGTHPYALTIAWREGLNYLRDNTSREYGVVSWWDYGYWIAREAKRGVPCHPGGGNTDKVALFFLAQTTDEANSIMDKLCCRYVVIDYQMAKQKFYAMPILAGIKGFTDSQYNDSMLARLYYSQGIEGYKLIFESTTKYEEQAQIKIFEYTPVSDKCDCEAK